MPIDLSVQLGALLLANPVLAAAGTFGYGEEFQRAVRLSRLGAIVTKTITRAPRLGNPPPRIVETPSGMLNSVGLQNVGLQVFVEEKLPHLGELGVPIIVSVLGESTDDVQRLCGALDRHAVVSAIELNLSCPNIRARQPGQGLAPMVAQDPESTALMVSTARTATRKPLIAKLSPDVTDARPIAQAAEQAGADALAVSNTFTGMSLDAATRRSRLGALTGGLSGPAIRPMAVYRVWLIRQAVRCPIIGLGGIVRAEDAVEFFLAGATAVAVGTASFADATAPVRVRDGLERYLARHGFASVRDLVGALQEQPPAAADG